MRTLEELKRSLYRSQTSFDSLAESYHEALVEIKRFTGYLRKAQQNGAMQCSECGGHWLCLADGARLCRCVPEPEMTEASK